MPPLKPSDTYDVAIIGGGPAGSVAATWLAQQGHRVAQFEKECFPRFHIGESLLPNGNAALKAIGVWDKIAAAGFIEKRGAEFTVPDRSRSVLNLFAQGLVPRMDQTFQVERARFDDILFRHALENGADSRQETAVRDARFGRDSWTLSLEDLSTGARGDVSARWIIDASGRNCLIGRTLKLKKEELPYPGRLAVFNHFASVPRGSAERAGDIIVLRLKDAWFWMIPISQETMSVGVVAQKGAGLRAGETREAFFWRKVSDSAWLAATLSAAEPLGEYRIESDYSFSYETFGASKALLAGDAASFIDPVFSSGVYLALESGLLSAQLISKELKMKAARTDPAAVYQRYTQRMKKRIGVMRRLIEAYYEDDSFEVFMTPKPPLNIDRAVNSVLAGCLEPPITVRWRFWIFRLVCRIHKRLPLVPKLNW